MFIRHVLCRKTRVLLLRGPAQTVLKSEEARTWLKKTKKRVKLFVADRPFNILTDGGSPQPFDNMTADDAMAIAAAEKSIAHTKCRYLSRISFKSRQDWVAAYKNQNLHEQTPLHVVRDGNTIRGARFTGRDQQSTYT